MEACCELVVTSEGGRFLDEGGGVFSSSEVMTMVTSSLNGALPRLGGGGGSGSEQRSITSELTWVRERGEFLPLDLRFELGL